MASLEVVNDYDDESDLVQVTTLEMQGGSGHMSEDTFEDPFSKSWDDLQKLDGLSTKFRRNTTRFVKAYTGRDEAKSKKLDPLDLTGYSLFQIVQPPYNVMYLAQLYDISPFHHAAINAKVANVVGLGYRFGETQATLDKLEDAATNAKRLDKLRRKVATAKGQLRDYLESMNSDDNFLWIMEKIYTDLETTGNGYMEIGRTANGRIGYIGHIPATTMRIRRHRDGYVQVVYIDLRLSSGTTDAASIVVETGWDGGALVSDTATDTATKSATPHNVITTIAAADVLATPSVLTVALTPPTHGTNAIQLHGARLRYKSTGFQVYSGA